LCESSSTALSTLTVPKSLVPVFVGNTTAACFRPLLTADTESTWRVGRYKEMRDRMMVAATAKSIKPSNSIQTTGATEFHRLNNE